MSSFYCAIKYNVEVIISTHRPQYHAHKRAPERKHFCVRARSAQSASQWFYRLCRAQFWNTCVERLRQNLLCSFIVLYSILRGGVCWCNFVTPLKHHFHHLLTHIRGLRPLFYDIVLAHLLPFSGKHIVCVRNSEKPFLMCFENTLVFYRSSDP